MACLSAQHGAVQPCHVSVPTGGDHSRGRQVGRDVVVLAGRFPFVPFELVANPVRPIGHPQLVDAQALDGVDYELAVCVQQGDFLVQGQLGQQGLDLAFDAGKALLQGFASA